jgi:bloom syndrome protein
MLSSSIQVEDDLHSPLHDVFLALWKTMWHASKDCHMPDPTICFLSLFALKAGGEFCQPKETTGIIARLCRAIQLSTICEIHRLVDSGEMSHQLEAMESLPCYVREKETTIFNSLMSLQHYATSLAFQTMSLPCIWWLDRVNWHDLLYLGQHITFQHIQTVFSTLENQIIHLLEDKIMLGLDLHVKYGVVVDNLMHTESGYCFLEDPKNPFSQYKTALGDAIFSNPKLQKCFITSANTLNALVCREWLVDLAKIEVLLMVDVEMKGGAPACATELISMM